MSRTEMIDELIGTMTADDGVEYIQDTLGIVLSNTYNWSDKSENKFSAYKFEKSTEGFSVDFSLTKENDRNFPVVTIKFFAEDVVNYSNCYKMDRIFETLKANDWGDVKFYTDDFVHGFMAHKDRLYLKAYTSGGFGMHNMLTERDKDNISSKYRGENSCIQRIEIIAAH